MNWPLAFLVFTGSAFLFNLWLWLVLAAEDSKYAKVSGCDYKELDGIKPNSNRPAEAYFMGIKKGDTPETNPIAKEVLGWIDELLEILKK